MLIKALNYNPKGLGPNKDIFQLRTSIGLTFFLIILKALKKIRPKWPKKERQFLKNGLITFFLILHGDAN